MQIPLESVPESSPLSPSPPIAEPEAIRLEPLVTPNYPHYLPHHAPPRRTQFIVIGALFFVLLLLLIIFLLIANNQ